MNVLSLFGWIEWGRAALDFLGITPDRYFSAEVDPYPVKISSANYPDIIHLGDVEKVRYYNWQLHTHPLEITQDGVIYERSHVVKIDLLIGWPPCQDLSIAKKNGKWLEWEKSKLFYEFVRILNEVKPKYFLMENVASMKRADESKITEILGVKPIMINSNLVSAQNRKRLYWFGRLNEKWEYETVHISQPKDEWIVLRDILEDIPMDDERWKPLDSKYMTEERMKKIRELTEKSGQLKSHSLTASYDGAIWWNSLDKSQRTVVFWILQIPRGKNNGNIHTEKSPTVTSNEFEHNNKVIAQNDLIYIWRKLTVRECARLQTLPDSFIFPVSDSRAYKAIGNGWTVKVIAHILSHIFK